MSNRNIAQPQFNNLVTGLDNYQRSYIQESSMAENKYLPKNTSLVDYIPKTADRYASMEGIKENYGHWHLQSEMDHLKKTIAEHETKFLEMSRNIEDMTSNFLMLKNTTQSEIISVRDLIKSNSNPPRGNLSSSYEKRITDLELSVRYLQNQPKRLNNVSGISKESSSEPVGTDVEKKINELNESIRQQLKVMDVNFVDLLCEKEQNIGNLSQEITLMQSNINILGDQIARIERTLSRKVDEGQLYKLIEPHLLNKGDVSMKQSRQGFFEKDIDSKIKELETSYNNIALIEKDIRGKHELYDLNLNSIKKHMELDLTVSLKQSIIPIQKNIESYLQGVESRINYLEDVVTKEIRKESLLFPPSVRDQTQTRTANMHFGKSVGSSQNIRESLGFGNHLLDSQVEPRFNEPKNVENLAPSYPSTQNFQHINNQGISSPKADRNNLEHLQTHDSIRIEEDEVNECLLTENNEPSEAKIARTLAPDQHHSKVLALSNSIRNVESCCSELPLLHDMPVPTKTTGAFKIIYQEYTRNQAHERTLKSSKEAQKIRSQGLREDNAEENQAGLRQQSRQAQEYNPVDRATGSAVRANQSDSSLSPPKNSSSGAQKKPLDQKIVEPPSLNAKDIEIDEGENFEGNIKGLLKKARKMRESYPPKEDPKDFKSPSSYEIPGNNPLGGRQTLESRQMFDPRQQQTSLGGLYGQNMPLRDLSRKSLLVEKDPDDPLPPLNMKGAKYLNKVDKYSRANGGQKPQNQKGIGYGRDLHNRAYLDPLMDEIQEGDDVEEIVYHVNEEGYLVDEVGNFLFDEQGNYIRLSPEQMREIEENEIIYQEQDNDYYR